MSIQRIIHKIVDNSVQEPRGARRKSGAFLTPLHFAQKLGGM
jgi:hypothetical protein